MPTKHFDEARRGAIAALAAIVTGDASIERAVLIDDLFGRIRVVVWGPAERRAEHERLISDRLADAAEVFWTGEIWHAAGASKADRLAYDRAWDEAHPAGERLRVADRVRRRTAWFRPLVEPPWEATGETAGPPIVVFYSFKGGVGRTTALASFAIQRARAGERVVVLDLDLDAPGAGTLLAADENGTTAPWGVADYMLERPIGEVPLRDYYHACRRRSVTGDGEILVIPAGSLAPEREYLGKLARLDLEPPVKGTEHHPLRPLLEQVRAELQPRWLLIDARAGLSEPAGLLLSGLAHLHILFGTSSEQSWLGLRLVAERLGASRVREDRPQLECVLVHAMVPEDIAVAKDARGEFDERALEVFRGHYYAADPDDPDEDRLWYIRDSEAGDAPHVPAVISYHVPLARYRRIDDVADSLAEMPEYRALGERIAQRFERTEE